MSHLRPIAVVCLMLGMVGCSADLSSPDPSPVEEGGAPEASSPEAPSPEASNDPLPSGHAPLAALAPPVDYAEPTRGGRGAVGGVEATPDPEAASRNLRRMTIDQLRDAIITSTGGLYWSDDRGRDILEMLAPSLGVPNYIDTTAEDLEPSLVFQKFLGDASRAVCTEAIQNDLEMAPGDRVLVRGVEPGLTWEQADEAQRAAIDQSLRHMNLRLTGHYIPQGDEEELGRLRWLFRSATHATGGDAARGWRAVCVGLMTSPEFYLY
ncbi:MAG: hypothetical protein CMH57_00465 [Myxococcales bacterium]|nr:hypothetical protein [Myxococcales bacterium]